MASIVGLTCYPIKGCAGTSLFDAVLTPAGLRHDRSFMVIGDDGVFRSQRREPQLALIRPDVGDDGESLTMGAPGVESVRIDVHRDGALRDVEMFGRPYRGVDQGDTAADWLSDVLGAKSRLVHVPPGHDRVTDGRIPGTAGYADGAAVHVLSRSSLDSLNARVAQRAVRPLPMSRFRPNIVVDGWDEPHVEDLLRSFTVGDVELGYTKLAVRCAVTLVNQVSGRKAGPEPLRTLADYRRAAEGGVAFGTKFAVVRPGKLSVGDELDVNAWGESDL